MKEINSLFRKEILLEWKKPSSIGGLLLYLISTVFISYLAFKGAMDMAAWIAIFWIILLFASVNVAAKSFMGESANRTLYYYSVAGASSIILSKILYNVLLLLTICTVHLILYSILLGNPIQNYLLFILTAVLGSVGLATALTLVSAIASKAGNNTVLMAILGFPVLLPLLLTCIKLSRNAAFGMSFALCWKFLLVLLCLNLILTTLSYILFPYLWRE